MTRKTKPEIEPEEEFPLIQEDKAVPSGPNEPSSLYDQGEGGFVPDTNFDLEDEYKPEPLAAGGNYRGNVIGVVFDSEQSAIVWKVALADNGGIMSDGESPIDGSHHYYRNWLPKPGDESEPTKGGRGTKRQSKINMMKRFADDMKISMNTPAIIAEAITNQDWIGLPVIVTISINEYMGITRNQIDKMVISE